jgi:integrase
VGVRVRFHRGAWWVFVQHRNRRRSKKVGDRQTANRVAQQIRERLAGTEFQLTPKQEQQTVEAYAQTWIGTLTGNLKASTIRFYTDHLQRHIIPILGSRFISSLSRADCREVITTVRGKGLRLSTVKGIARTLSTLLSQAVEDEKLPANPALRMGRYLRGGDEIKPHVQVLTREEAALLVATARTHFPRWHPWILLALRTGLRLGEQIALQWGDVDWNGRFLVVQRKLSAGACASQGYELSNLDLSITDGNTTRRAQHSARLQSHAREGRAAPHPRARSPSHVRIVATAARGVDRLRQGAARTRVDSDHRRHVRSPDSRRESRRRGSS